jgi:outer membrane lipoprotein-sorting protein
MTVRPLAFLLAVTACVAPGLAKAPTAPPAPPDVQGVIAKMLARNASLASYEARVHVNLHMLNFPFLAPKLDGTSYYKRPDEYEVVFDRVPGYAKGFEKIFNDVDDPLSWQKDQNIELRGETTLDGHKYLVLYLTKKQRSDILDHTVAYVDPENFELPRMEWHYTDGGEIVMTQQYHNQGDFAFVAAQHVTINLPRDHVRAVGDSQFESYQTNVAVDDSVFTKKP